MGGSNKKFCPLPAEGLDPQVGGRFRFDADVGMISNGEDRGFTRAGKTYF